MQPKPIALSLKHKNTVCWELFSKVVMTCCFYWFLSSGGIDGNEKADALLGTSLLTWCHDYNWDDQTTFLFRMYLIESNNDETQKIFLFWIDM